jgi:exodeoxyribonuclease-3
VGERLEVPGFLAEADTGYHVAAFARRELAVQWAAFGRPEFFHALVGMRVVLPGSAALHVLGAHFCPDSPHTRLAESRNLLKLMHGAEHTLIAGDLNSPDPQSDHTATLAAMRRRERARYVAADDSGAADTRALQALEEAGLVDVGRRHGDLGHTLPTALPVPGAAFAPLRLDYFYATPRLAAATSHYRVLRNARTDGVSDHYPVAVDVDVESLADPAGGPS